MNTEILIASSMNVRPVMTMTTAGCVATSVAIVFSDGMEGSVFYLPRANSFSLANILDKYGREHMTTPFQVDSVTIYSVVVGGDRSWRFVYEGDIYRVAFVPEALIIELPRAIRRALDKPESTR